MLIRALATLGVITVFSCACLAQDSIPAPPKNAQALALVQAALGKHGAPSQTASCTATGTLQLLSGSPKTYPITFKSYGLRKLRTELQTDKGTRVVVVNDGFGTIFMPDGTLRRLSVTNTQTQRVSYIPSLSLFGEAMKDDTSVELYGKSQINGSSETVVSVGLYRGKDKRNASKLQAHTRTYFAINDASGLVDHMQYSNYAEQSDSNVQKVDVLFADYRLIDGFLIPFHQTTSGDGSPMTDLMLTSATCNGSPVVESDFDLK
jgi:hypothetical protein